MNCLNQTLISSGFVGCQQQSSGCSCNNSQQVYYLYSNPTNGLKVKLMASGAFQILSGTKVLQYGIITSTDESQLIDRLGKV